MNTILTLLIIPAAVAAIISYISTPWVIKLAWKYKLIDDPKKNNHIKVIHEKPTPRGGGLAVYIGVLVASLIFLPHDSHLTAILLGGAFLIILGLLDDRHNLHPLTRLIVQFLVSLFPVAAGIGIAFLTNPFGGQILDISNPKIVFNFFGEHSIWILSDLFAIFWLVLLMNFLNMGAKGVDGQVTGITVIAAFVIAFLSFEYSADISEWPVIILASIVGGSYLGFLPWHIYPQKIMPSFGGATLAGYLLGVLSILSTTKVGTLMVVLAIPLVDTGYVIVRRILSGKMPYWGDRGHLHHKLMDIGFSKAQVALIYWCGTALLGFLALNLNAISKFYTIIGITVLLLGLFVWIMYRPNKN